MYYSEMRSLSLLGFILFICLQQVFMFDNIDLSKTSSEEYRIVEQCGAQHGLTIQDLTVSEDVPEDQIGENIKCVMNCVLFQRSYVDEGGRIRVETILDEIVKEFGQPHPELRALLAEPLQNCRNVEGATPCQVAYNTYKCLYA